MRLWISLFALGLGACAPASLPALGPASVEVDDVDDVEGATPRAVVLPTNEPLPAGIYQRLHTYRPCLSLPDLPDGDSLCVAPTHAVVAGIHVDAQAAEVAVRRADRLPLPPGYPFVAHTGELGVDEPVTGIAVVLGQFASKQHAESWATALAAHLPARTIALATPEKAFAGLERDGPLLLAARITSPDPVPAHASASVVQDEGPELLLPPDHSDDGGGWDIGEPKTAVVCMLAPGAVVVADHSAGAFGFYRWAPVECPRKQRAWVRWRDTSLGVTVRRVGEQYEAIRLVEAECDSPLFERWTLRPDSPKPLQVAAAAEAVAGPGGCSG